MEPGACARVAVVMVLCAVAVAAGKVRRQLKVLDRYPGDLCPMECGRPGICRSIEHCPDAAEMLRKGWTPVVCSYKDTVPIICCPSVSKSHKMCEQYSSAVYSYEVDPTSPSGRRKCDHCMMKDVPFIVGGSNASVHEFPHMALLGFGDDRSAPRWDCGGSLISDRFVLTAAHCILTSGGAPKWVRLGELDLTRTDESQHQDYDVVDAIAHPDFKDGVHYNDIGILKLDRKVTFSAAIRPACLHSLPEITDKLGIASGWGLIDWAVPVNSPTLIKLNLHLYKRDVCSFAYRTTATTFRLKNGITEESMVCAGSPEGGKDTCRGDSGGPLMIKLSQPYCMYSLIGVTSFGKGQCGTTTSPSVYTRVSHFVSWIEEVVWPDEPPQETHKFETQKFETQGPYPLPLDVRQRKPDYLSIF